MRGFLAPPLAPPRLDAHPQTEIHPGFGVVSLCENGVEIARDVDGRHKLRYFTDRAESLRGADPRKVFTLHVDGPFESQLYAYGTDGWVLVDRKDGFS